MRRSSARLRDLAVAVAVVLSLVLLPPAAPAGANSSCTQAEWGTYSGTAASIGIGWVGYVPDQWSVAIKPPGSGGLGTVIGTATRSSRIFQWDTTRWSNSYYDFTIISGRSTWYYPCGIRVLNLPTAPSAVNVSPSTNTVDVFDASWVPSSSANVAYYEYAIDCTMSRVAQTSALGARLVGEAQVRGSAHSLCVRTVDRSGARSGFRNSNYFVYASVTPTIALSAPATAVAGSTVTAIVSLTDPSGRPVAGKRIDVTSGFGGQASGTTDVSGRATISLQVSLAARTAVYGMTATFSGDAMYRYAAASRSITILARPTPTIVLSAPATAVAGSTVTATVSLTDPSGRPLAGKRVTVESGFGPASATTDASGRATVQLQVPPYVRPGVYSILATFAGDGTYTYAQSSSGRITILARPTPTIVLSAPATAVAGSTVTATVSLTDPSGRPLAGQRIDVGGGVVFPVVNATTDAAGRATVALQVPASTRPAVYGIYASIPLGDARYAYTRVVSLITILPRPADVTPPSVPSVTVSPASSTTNRFTATFPLPTDDLSGLDGIEFRIDGGTVLHTGSFAGYTAPTVSLTIQAPSYGIHRIEVRSMDKVGNRSAWSVPASFEWRRATTSIAIARLPAPVQRCSSIDFAARLTSEGTALPGRAVSLRIGGTGATATTDASGVASASIPIELPPGSYTASATFAGDATMPAAQATVSVQVTGSATASCKPAGGGEPPGGGQPPGGGSEPPGGGQGPGGQTQGGLSVDIPPR